ncbi:MAG: uracil-DNA glycosylase family protein [Sulfuritalea sp.]|nr:uracil-DNA glycosylase family protein [Sulfuritalea sp.]
MESLPTYPQNDLFATDFTPHTDLPGFFPGAGGFFHGVSNTTKRFLFFGTDFGPRAYQRDLRSTGGEPESVATLRQLRTIVSQAGIPLSDCFLTNAVLCVRRGDSATDAFPIWRQYPEYMVACASWHRRQIAEQKPVAVVLMGRPHLNHFGRLLFPELAQHWARLKTMKSVYDQGKEVFSLADGTNVLLLLHPSFWHAHPPALKAKAIEHLSRWA